MTKLIDYTMSLDDIDLSMLVGFFDGWPNAPSASKHLSILDGSSQIVLAVDCGNARVVGFINAISDGVFSAAIPLLEVHRDYRGRGIGSELVRRMLHELRNFYSIDLVCDNDLRRFYTQLGLTPATAMISRNYSKQA